MWSLFPSLPPERSSQGDHIGDTFSSRMSRSCSLSPSTGSRPADTQTALPVSGSSGPRAGAPEGGGGRSLWQLVVCDLICGGQGGESRTETAQTKWKDHRSAGSSLNILRANGFMLFSCRMPRTVVGSPT